MSVTLDNGTAGNVGVSTLDSFTVNTSTVQLTHMPSAATGTLLVGKATVPNAGEVMASSYFRIGFSNVANDIPAAAVFDSLNLVLKPNRARYYFGDTTQIQTIHVHRVTQALETKTPTPSFPNQPLPVYVTGASIFSGQQFNYDNTPLGSLTFRPRVSSVDTLSIKLSQALGQNLFDLIKSGDVRVSSNENFQNYFKGMALVPEAGNSAVFGFTDTLQVKINYSYLGADGNKRTAAKELNITDRTYQYNHISYDRAGTAFESLSTTTPEIKTTATAGLTYVQSGTGVVAKLSFPSLKEFLQDENIAINKAELVIESASNMNSVYGIPGSLMLFVANPEGIPTSFLTTPYGTGVQQAAYVPSGQVTGNGTYTFNMIVYLKNVKSTSVYDNTSLYVADVSSGLFNTFNTAFFATENGKPKIKLNILYTKFK
ncbi:DUF4270 family protein [Sphingobacterium suaedae]